MTSPTTISKYATILVMGGAGFIGSHTVDALANAGYKVRIFDRTPSPYLTPDCGHEMIVADVLDTGALEKAMTGCEAVYHFAGIADLEEAKKDPSRPDQINVLGTVQALEIARKVGIKRFVFASTVYVYSNSGSFYRASKQACENFIEEYRALYNLPFTIVRYGSLYGRRAGAENGLFRLIRSALETGKMTYNGDPDAVREYIHVTDAARLSVDILAPEYENRHIMLTGQTRLRVADMMRMIAEMMPNSPQLTFGEKTLAAHYVMTPYNYNPKLAHKLTCNDHVELGQGILDCIACVYEEKGMVPRVSGPDSPLRVVSEK